MITNRRTVLAALAAFTGIGPAIAAGKPHKKNKAMFSAGFISDVQYENRDDDIRDAEHAHYYRRAPEKFRAALAEMNRHDLGFVVHLGDLINGGWDSLAVEMAAAATSRHPMHYVLGNHDFTIPEDKKRQLPATLGMPARYYDFSYGGWRFVVLDGTDQSVFGWPAGSPEDLAARAVQKDRYPDGKPWNGAIGPEQMQWLKAILTQADTAGTPVALLCHFPVWPQTDANILLWNAAEVVAAIEPHPCVKLWLNGHEHKGGYGEKAGIHYVNFKGVLDTEENAFTLADFYPGRVELHGFGRETSRSLILR